MTPLYTEAATHVREWTTITPALPNAFPVQPVYTRRANKDDLTVGHVRALLARAEDLGLLLTQERESLQAEKTRATRLEEQLQRERARLSWIEERLQQASIQISKALGLGAGWTDLRKSIDQQMMTPLFSGTEGDKR